jgi:hypothetical protein
VTASDPAVKVNYACFRDSWYDALTMGWKDVASVLRQATESCPAFFSYPCGLKEVVAVNDVS